MQEIREERDRIFIPSKNRVEDLIMYAVAKEPELAGHIPADAYHAWPQLSTNILQCYQDIVLHENASMGAGVDRTELVERVKHEVAEMNRAFDIAEKSKPENLFADVSFEREK